MELVTIRWLYWKGLFQKGLPLGWQVLLNQVCQNEEGLVLLAYDLQLRSFRLSG